MMTPYCHYCRQPMPRRTPSGYCDHCNPGQDEPSSRHSIFFALSVLAVSAAVGLLLGGVAVGLVMMQIGG